MTKEHVLMPGTKAFVLDQPVRHDSVTKLRWRLSMVSSRLEFVRLLADSLVSTMAKSRGLFSRLLS